MPRYRILHRYSSNQFGPFEEGTEIELTEDDAQWLLNDSPGVLEEIDPSEQQAKKRAENERRAAAYREKAERDADKTIAAATATKRRARPLKADPKPDGGS